MLRWHLQQGRSAIPKSTKPARIAENFAVFDFELSKSELAAIDALDNWRARRARARPDHSGDIQAGDSRGVTPVAFQKCRT
jgi:diketogulonate reductase-like aldo/keto reductase